MVVFKVKVYVMFRFCSSYGDIVSDERSKGISDFYLIFLWMSLIIVVYFNEGNYVWIDGNIL